MHATSSTCTKTKPMKHMARLLQESKFLTFSNPQTFANRIANLRKPLVKRPKLTMSTLPNLPKPSHKPSSFSTSPGGNAQNWGAACALFKILKKAQAMTFFRILRGAPVKGGAPAGKGERRLRLGRCVKSLPLSGPPLAWLAGLTSLRSARPAPAPAPASARPTPIPTPTSSPTPTSTLTFARPGSAKLRLRPRPRP